MSAPRPLRPLFVTGSLAHGGAEQHSVALVNRLAERGHACHLASVKEPSALLDRLRPGRGGTVQCLGAARYLDRRAISDLAATVARIAPSAIVAQNPYALLYASAARALARSPAPMVTVFHSNRLLGPKEWLQMAAYRPLYWAAACTVFVCEAQRRHWMRRGVRSRRNEVIHNGVDLRAFDPGAVPEPARLALRQALGLRAEDYVVGVTAALRPEKNHVLLVDALAELRRRGIRARALLIGDGPARPAIEERARALGVSALVSITGFLPDVRAHVLACDTMALPSLSEALPLAALESLALGKPLVHSAVGGAAEVVSPGVNGYLFPSGDSAELADRLAELADPALRSRMGEQARRIAVARFSQNAMVTHYERLLREVEQRAPARRHPSAARAPGVLLLGPGLQAVSGVSSHLRALLGSALGETFELAHFQVGSEGSHAGPLRRLARLAASPLALARAIRRNHAAIVHVNTSLNAGAFWRDFAYVLVARASGARVVYQVHGGKLPQSFAGGLWPLDALLRWALRQAHLIVVLARSELDAYRRFLPGRRIELVPNAVAGIAPPRAAAGADSPLRLLYLGRLAAGKGLRELLHALARLQQAEPVVARLAVAGSGPELDSLAALARDLGLAAAVRFCGVVRGESKSQLLGESDVFVLPSEAEGMPCALIEAMAAGLPVVATRVGAIPDLVADGVHGVLVPARDPAALADALRLLAGDRARLARMGEAARARAREVCSIERIAGRFGEIYGELAEPGVGWPSPAG